VRPHGLEVGPHPLEDRAEPLGRQAGDETRRGGTQNTRSCGTRRTRSATPLSGRPMRASPSAPLTGRVKTRSRQPRRRHSLKGLSAAGDTRSVSRAVTSAGGGARGGGRRRSRGMARV
jgi:hypothetical protein